METSSGGNYYALLDPGDYNHKSPTQKRKKSDININSNSSFPLLGQKTPLFKVQCPKYVTIKSAVPEKPINNYDIFLVSKALENICAEPPQQISFTRDGNLLVLTKNDTQANKFLKAKNLVSVCPIISELHPTLNTVKGVIFTPSLRSLSDKDIVEGLRDQSVTDCQKIKKVVKGELVNTSLHILSSNRYEIPKEIKIGFLVCKVDPYIPAPIQCKNCFKLGHTKKHCKENIEKCEVCSENIHDPTMCKMH
ncbi:PREDICTED: uncharacterized protein LOC108376392 [Rhagoletis zephyria]|uniref:uncharacterized protein LOC108376392 n=1 Tax=Rhagoletis zephyria TaxID=28612 RepID=UPI0008114BFE|nr:PREDICTED: uncharacterized protein LOC108376392 [Rhagoletis zephyria]